MSLCPTTVPRCEGHEGSAPARLATRFVLACLLLGLWENTELSQLLDGTPTILIAWWDMPGRPSEACPSSLRWLVEEPANECLNSSSARPRRKDTSAVRESRRGHVRLVRVLHRHRGDADAEHQERAVVAGHQAEDDADEEGAGQHGAVTASAGRRGEEGGGREKAHSQPTAAAAERRRGPGIVDEVHTVAAGR